MPALNFKKQFQSAVLTGRKAQTIRATRKHPIKAGDKLYLYTGMRTKDCLRLRVTPCTKVTPIKIVPDEVLPSVILGGRTLSFHEQQELAKKDGFFMAEDFFRFFRETHGERFEGQLIEWRA